jgi:hypothetical protein
MDSISHTGTGAHDGTPELMPDLLLCGGNATCREWLAAPIRVQ